MIYSLDTNIISYMLQKNDLVLENYKQEIKKGAECIIPPMVYYEIKRGLLYKNALVQAKSFDNFCKEFKVGEMNRKAWDKAAQIHAYLRQRGRIIDDGDIIIAAFCLANAFTLVTNNKRHFENVNGLEFVDWSK